MMLLNKLFDNENDEHSKRLFFYSYFDSVISDAQ